MTEPLASGSHAAEVELVIDQFNLVGPAEATATVRCVLGPVRLGARFDRIIDSTETVDLELTQILAYFGRAVEELDPVHTAFVTLHGTGVRLLVPAAAGSRRPVIQGTNPPP
ncbi:hypothetical protein [Streptomyces sp. NPDC001770]